jgi:hypothetical protein
MMTDHDTIARVLQNVLRDRYQDGDIEPDANGYLLPSMLYPWHESQLMGVHMHRKGFGDGVYFRLKDGSVWNAYGEPCTGEIGLDQFDTVAN